MRQLILAILLLTATIRAAPATTVGATKAGVVGDGAKVNTVAIQNAIDACTGDGGGTIQFPAGRYVTGARQIGLLISGITNHPVENLTLENIQIELAGGGKLADTQIQLPEKEAAYPEYSMFGRAMPAYGIYARHVRGVNFKNVQMTVKNPDARPANIFVDVEGATPADFAPSPANPK
jgi:hypothetical protein